MVGFSPVQVRSHVARVGSVLHTVAMAIEKYHTDTESFPPSIPLAQAGPVSEEALRQAGGGNLRTVARGTGADNPGLTTPVAYIPDLPVDPFAPHPGAPYAWHTSQDGYILNSPCPNGRYDIDPEQDYAVASPPGSVVPLIERTYDPTNGLDSFGDMWRVREIPPL